MPPTKRSKTRNVRTSPFSIAKNVKRSDGDNVVDKILQDMEDKLHESRNEVYAVQIKQYMRNKFDMFGVKSPERRSICKQVLQEYPTLSRRQGLDLLWLAWQKPQRDFQYFATDYAQQNVKSLMGPTSVSCNEFCELTKKLITTKSWWDTVDMLAINVLGPIVASYPKDFGPLMDQWIDDDNMWVRRTAILHQLKFKNKTDSQKLFRYCLQRGDETEFFIQKSIGWALREYGKYNKSGVKDFVRKNQNKLSVLSVKEALKHLGTK